MTSLGVDLGGTKVLGVALSERRQVMAERRLPTPRGSAAVVAAVVEMALALEAAVGDPTCARGPFALGVGVPGLVDRRGVLGIGPHLPGVTDLAVTEEVAAALAATGDGQRRVVADNDATCAVVGETALGAGQGAEDVLFVALGTGVGGGFVSGGRLVRGRHGFAGEFGHMTVVPDGLPCPCGRRGCWERYASGNGLVHLARAAAREGRLARALELAGGDPRSVRGEHLTVAAGAGDEEAGAVLDAFARWVGLGLANLTAALDPEVIVLGGGVMAAANVLLGRISRQFAEAVFGAGHRPLPDVVAARMGEQAGAVGAALLAAGPDPEASTGGTATLRSP